MKLHREGDDNEYCGFSTALTSEAYSTWSEWTSLSLEEKNYRILTQAEECASFCANKGCAAFHVREQKECWCNKEAYYNSITDFADCGQGECIVADETAIDSSAGKAAFGAPCEVSSCPDAYYQEERGMYCNQWHSCQWVDMVSATGLTTMTIDHDQCATYVGKKATMDQKKAKKEKTKKKEKN